MAQDISQQIQTIRGQEEEQRTAEAAKRQNIPYVNLVGYPIAPDVLALIPLDIVQRLQLLPFLKVSGTIKLATPKISLALLEYARTLANETNSKVILNLCSQSSFLAALAVYLRHDAERQERERALQAAQQEDKKIEFGAISSLEKVAELAKTISTSDLLKLIFAGAVGAQASDIHLEAQENQSRLRYRIDGVLQDVTALTAVQHKAIVSRIKNEARLKLDISGAPQDGRMSLVSAGVSLDIRVSTIPSAFGEDVVLRLLRQDIQFLTLEQLGFSPAALSLINEAISKPHGMILNTGPTGSGKTTTLYAILAKLNQTAVKIITIEDPIEYRLPGVNQTQVNTVANYTFANALRSVVRQDPDIIMVGEIRDPETAQIALQAALTGHLVLSSLHTNNAAGAIPRLLEMGVEPFLLAGSINLIIAQRLVRRICPDCRGQGCAHCHKTGYKGRLPIVELLKPTSEFNALIARKASVAEFERKAVELGMATMHQDGLGKASAGLTTKEEVERVTQE